jgi:serine phosphatase RsbU (regulator of sigma subunit)
MQSAIDSGEAFSVSDTRTGDLAAEWPSVVQLGIRSVYCIPLRKPVSAKEPGQLLGLLYLDSQIGAGNLTEVDHQVLGAIATEAAALVHNAVLADEYNKARQEREELAVAAGIHSGLMSIVLPVLPYAVLQAKSVPCLAIGGDFFDAVAFDLDDCLYVAVADVSGKGVSAAIVAATLQGIIHSQFLAGQSLSKIADVVNHFLLTRNVGKYATMVLLKLKPNGELEYLNCGHILPLSILGTDVRRLEQSNLVVGLVPGAEYGSSTYAMRAGERILLATDGVTEAENSAGLAFGEPGLISVSHHQQIDEILDEVAKFQVPNPAQDDCTLVELKFSP